QAFPSVDPWGQQRKRGTRTDEASRRVWERAWGASRPHVASGGGPVTIASCTAPHAASQGACPALTGGIPPAGQPEPEQKADDVDEKIPQAHVAVGDQGLMELVERGIGDADQGGDPAPAGQGLGGGGRRSGSGTAEQVRQAGPKGDQRAEQPVGDEVRDLVAEGKLGKRQVI